jgi:antitoxin MazE
MKGVVKKWGKGASVRIPAAVLQAANLTLDEQEDIREESGRIVKGITRENLHGEASFGDAVGQAVW